MGTVVLEEAFNGGDEENPRAALSARTTTLSRPTVVPRPKKSPGGWRMAGGAADREAAMRVMRTTLRDQWRPQP